jgi:hypothetical protein
MDRAVTMQTILPGCRPMADHSRDPVTANFVHPLAAEWKDHLRTGDNPERFDVPATLFKDTSDAYVIRTFIELLRAGSPVLLSERPLDDRVNVVYTWHNPLRRISARTFIVAVQADCYRPFACDMRLVGNVAQATSPIDQVIPPWPQPGLIPRDPARGTRVETVGFLGFHYNLDPAIRSDSFARRLNGLGCRLVLKGPAEWHDFSDVDVVLGLRPAAEPLLRLKPPTKLVNSWMAGCPAILGKEPGFQGLRQVPLDYFEVADADEAFAAIARLAGDQRLYADCVERCLARAREFQLDLVLAKWESVLTAAEQRRKGLSAAAPSVALRYSSKLAAACAEKISRARFTRMVKRR